MIKRVLLAIALIATLLAAQQLAIAHELWHLRDYAGSQSGGKSSTQPGSCDYHAAYAEVLGAVASSALPPALGSYRAERTARFVFTSAHRDLIAPASRGPPAFL